MNAEIFVPDFSRAIANEHNVIQGKKYRFTILSERLIRMEYNVNGIFEDRPTSLVLYRDTPKVEFKVKEDSVFLEIETKYFRLTYRKNKPFYSGKINSMKNLKVELLNSDKIWFYGHPEVRNFGCPDVSLDNKKTKIKNGLYSIDGFASIDDSKNNIINEKGIFEPRPNNTVDTYLFMYLKDFAQCLQDYFQITGFPSLIPRYALGNWWSKNDNYNDATLKKLVDDFKEYEVPLSIILLDKKWHISDKKDNFETGFSWNRRNFYNPQQMIKYLHQSGIRLGLNINPLNGFYPVEEKYLQLTKLIKPDEKGIIPFNVYDYKTLMVYFEGIIQPLNNDGVDFFWIDNEEATKNNESAIITNYHFLDMKKDYTKRPMTLTRNTTSAPHRYPVLYSGKTIVNWDTLKDLLLFNISSSNIGASFWAHDIGGYYKGIEDNELYIRYVQLGVFSPVLKFGADSGKYYKREPWKWSIKTYAIAKDYLNLRHRLIPYLYAESYKYHEYGMPIIQPIYYRNPEMYDDINYKNSYYFGTELFVSPIVNKKDYVMNRAIHKFFLPDGVWYDFVTGKKFPGGKSYLSFFKDQDYPVFAKAGSIIPLGSNKNINDTTPPTDMEIQIFPGQSNTYMLYEDDGISDLYKKGFYLISQIDYNYMPNNYTVIIRPIKGKKGIVPEVRNYKLVFRNTKKANDVIVYYNNELIESKNYVSGTNFIVEIDNISPNGQLTVNCKGKDIEIDAVRIINDDVESIISDLQIETDMKELIDKVLFSDLPINKKRIEIRKLGRKGLEHKFIKVFLKILEYIKEV